MLKKQAALQALLHQRMLPLYYHDSEEISRGVLKALYSAGIRCVEYTNRGKAALQNFRSLKKLAVQAMPQLQLGIGTIKNTIQAKEYIEAGADFIVCPTVNAEVAAITHQAGLLWIPGCMTPTEIAIAENAGATIVKIFPGNILGHSFISAINDLFPELSFMPTGGVEAETSNLNNWFGAGVVAVGMGSKLITKEAMEKEDFDAIHSAAEKALKLIEEVNTRW